MTEQRSTDEQIKQLIANDEIAWLPIHTFDEAVEFYRWAILSADRGELVARVIVYEKDFPHVDVVDWGDKDPPPGEYKLYAAAPSTTQPAPEITAKPLVWTQVGNDWHDECGFYIMPAADDLDYPWSACWGEGDPETFATLEEAKVWCQKVMNAWIRERGQLATPQQRALYDEPADLSSPPRDTDWRRPTENVKKTSS